MATPVDSLLGRAIERPKSAAGAVSRPRSTGPGERSFEPAPVAAPAMSGAMPQLPADLSVDVPLVNGPPLGTLRASPVPPRAEPISFGLQLAPSDGSLFYSAGAMYPGMLFNSPAIWQSPPQAAKCLPAPALGQGQGPSSAHPSPLESGPSMLYPVTGGCQCPRGNAPCNKPSDPHPLACSGACIRWAHSWGPSRCRAPCSLGTCRMRLGALQHLCPQGSSRAGRQAPSVPPAHRAAAACVAPR